MTNKEIGTLITELKKVFDIVRLVDVSMMTQYMVTPEGNFTSEPYKCYAVWKRDGRCENCISAKAFFQKTTMTKFEFIEKDVYFVMAKYIEVEGIPYIMEMVTKITDQTLFGAYGKNSFIDTINSYNSKLYVDTLTGAYNRQYYNEQLQGLPKVNAVAMVDIDHFKEINDNFGHGAGDLVLQKVTVVMKTLLGELGAVVRYGGDEFVLAFQAASREKLGEVLEETRKIVSEISNAAYPGLKVTLSIGAVHCDSNATEKLEEADKALYEAKIERNKVVIKDI